MSAENRRELLEDAIMEMRKNIRHSIHKNLRLKLRKNKQLLTIIEVKGTAKGVRYCIVMPGLMY
jgi:hypothetical protein